MAGEPDDVDATVEPVVPYGRRGNGVVRHLGQSYDHKVTAPRGVHPQPLRVPDRRGAPGRPRRPGRAGRFLLDRASTSPSPGVPRDEVGFRMQVTAATTDEQVTELLAALDRLADVVPLRRV